MPKPPKPESDERKQNWAEDQKNREYYYDDAHGYERYEPGVEEDGETGESGDSEKESEKTSE
jgi:hypothetical protein